ncbi:hypothetical protein [Clostridium saccharoperbutylacetonicum]|uniref:hypothetical protein n=1 Tax=Clostridium saccharoperbutylacetonicum TaxID=36745 RepID=UPI0039E7EE4D
MENKMLIKDIAKLQILCTKWVERHTSLKCKTFRDIERVITANKLTCTYGEAVENLYNNIKKYCNNSNYLVEEILKLKENMNNSDIKDLRFGVEPQKKFSDFEKELDMEMIKRKFFMVTGIVSIKDAAEILGLTETAIKQACQQERLLNTSKIGKSWMVHIPECRSYWNLKDENEKHLYKDYVY